VRFGTLKLEYSRTLKPDDKDIIVSVRYLGKPLSVVVPRAILDDLRARVFAELTTSAERCSLLKSACPCFYVPQKEDAIAAKSQRTIASCSSMEILRRGHSKTTKSLRFAT
jgi:hypothetical protein